LERTNPQRFVKTAALSITPDQLDQFVQGIHQILAEEVPHPGINERIFSRLMEIDEQIRRDAWLVYRDPCPPPRRAPNSAARVARFKSSTRPLTPPMSDNVQ
jgi:hypothetical protein